MTLPASGTITGAMIRAEMDGLVGNLVFPSAGTLWLAGKAAAPIVIPTDYYSKTWGPSLNTPERFGALTSPGATWQIPSGAPYAIGDLVIVTQLAESSTATPPASVIPAGWTQIGTSLTLTTGDGTGARMNTSYRIITAGQLGSVVTGMNGTARNRVAGRLMHFNRALASIAVIDSAAAVSTAAIGSQNVAWNSVRDGSHLFWGAAHAELNIADADFTWSTAADAPLGSVGTIRTYHKIYENTAPVSSISMALADNGTFNGMFVALLRLI